MYVSFASDLMKEYTSWKRVLLMIVVSYFFVHVSQETICRYEGGKGRYRLITDRSLEVRRLRKRNFRDREV